MLSNLIFKELPTVSDKTKLFDVHSAQGDTNLGRIKWFSHWRRYVFFPCNGCLFDAMCLTEITTFLTNLMLARKREKKVTDGA